MRNMLKKIDIKTEKRAQSKQEHVLVVLHNCTNDYMWLSYTVLWGEKWCQLTHTTTEQWWVIPYKVMMLWTKRERKNAHTRLVTNDESSQLNTSHDEGNEVQGEGKRQPQCHLGNCDVTTFLRPLSYLPTLNWRDVVVYLWVRVAGQAALNQLHVAAPKGLTDMMSSQLRTVWLRHIELNQWKIWWRFEIWMNHFKSKKSKNQKIKKSKNQKIKK